MKTNVDLTLDRKFSRSGGSLRSLRRHVARLNGYNPKYPWDLKAINAPLYDSVVLENHDFFTGNKPLRQKKKKRYELYHEMSCECCGQDFKKKPWLKGKYTLCSKCEIRIETYEEKLWLRQLEEKIHRKRIASVEHISLEQVISLGDL